MNPVPTPRAMVLGALASLLYPVVVVVLQAVQSPQYHPGSQAISELALGRAGWLMAVAFCSLAVGTAALTRLVWSLTRSRVAAWLLAISAALTALSAFVHADGEHVHGTTLHGAIHQIAGVLTFAGTLVAMFLVARRLRRDPAWRTLGHVTLAMAVAGVAAFFLVPVLGNAHFGVAQRLLVGVLIAWNAGSQLYAARAVARPRRDHALQGARAPRSA
jgi:hypothetical protein